MPLEFLKIADFQPDKHMWTLVSNREHTKTVNITNSVGFEGWQGGLHDMRETCNLWY